MYTSTARRDRASSDTILKYHSIVSGNDIPDAPLKESTFAVGRISTAPVAPASSEYHAKRIHARYPDARCSIQQSKNHSTRKMQIMIEI